MHRLLLSVKTNSWSLTMSMNSIRQTANSKYDNVTVSVANKHSHNKNLHYIKRNLHIQNVYSLTYTTIYTLIIETMPERKLLSANNTFGRFLPVHKSISFTFFKPCFRPHCYCEHNDMRTIFMNAGHAKLLGQVLRVQRVLRRTPGVSNSN